MLIATADKVIFWPRTDYLASDPERSLTQRKFITLVSDGVGSLQRPPNHHLAQLNIGRIRYETDDPRMADFTNNLLALYRRERQLHQHAALCRSKIAINLSVWENVEALERFVYQTIHKQFYSRRAEWFEHFEDRYLVMWWVPADHRPSVEEAGARIEHQKQHGPSDYAFDWQTASAQLWKTARCVPAGRAA
jgi:hypothetical protein